MHTHELAAEMDIGGVLLHTFGHALVDTLKMLPFLFLAYLLIELIERRGGAALERGLARGGRWGFVPGALLGLVPQCGFSAMAANFYGSRVITLGTLLAVFIATSDEAIPIMLAQPDSYPAMGRLLLAKLAFGMLAGLSTNAGIGLTVLFRANKNLKQNLFILALLYGLGTVVGIVVHAFS